MLRAYIEDREPTLGSQLDWDDPIFIDQANTSAQDFTNRIDRKTDVVAFSCYVWNFKKHMKMARLLKERNPNVKIIAGGPHIPNDPTGFFDEHPYVDVIIHNEGEIAFSRVLKGDEQVPGTTTREFHCLRGENLPKRIELKSPYLEGYFTDIIKKLQKVGLEFWAPWETNRGCPYQCTFCDWGSSLMNMVRKFPMLRLYQEAEYFTTSEIENIYICDANYGILPRDEDLARYIAKLNSTTGYPKHLRGSFAKNSNDRVFNITKMWNDQGMVSGATLSMQSTNMNVLESIDRKNIGLKHYRELQHKYREHKVPTYTELILGLPNETKDTFINGICSLLQAGNHDDIRVWELSVLPNSPIATQQKMFRLDTIDKHLFLEFPKTPPDEIEISKTVVATNTMSRGDWVEAYLFAWVVQALHCGYYTRFISQYLWQEVGISYKDFYTGLIEYYSRHSSVLGTAIGHLRNRLHSYLTNEDVTLRSRVAGYGSERYDPADTIWLTLNPLTKTFYSELYDYLEVLITNLEFNFDAWDKEFESVVDFNRDMMFTQSYDPRQEARPLEYEHDVVGYFLSGDWKTDISKERPLQIWFYDETMGITKDPIVPNDAKAFAKAAVGNGFLISRVGRYVHQKVGVKYE